MSRFPVRPESKHWRGFHPDYGQNYGHAISMTIKLIRLARKAATDLGVKVLSSDNINGHHRFELELPNGSVRKLSFPSSPSCGEFSLMHFKKHIKQLLANPPTPKGKP